MVWIIRLLLNGFGVFLVAHLVPGISVSGYGAAVGVAFILAMVNIFIRPIIIFLTLPFNLLTFGLFTFVINAFLFWFTSLLINGIHVNGFIPAFLGSLFTTIITWLINKIFMK